MSANMNAYRRTHQTAQDDCVIAHEYRRLIADTAAHPEIGVQDVARKVHLPVVAVRGALSSFTDSEQIPGSVRVCTGTSCMLSGASDVWRDLKNTHPCEPVYCLGYCDRSPAAMTPKGHVVCELRGDSPEALLYSHSAFHPAPPDTRCSARRPIVTERLLTIGMNIDSCPAYDGLASALGMAPQQAIDMVIDAGVKGRGGAAYLTGRKWAGAARVTSDVKYVVANGDEGDPGSFIDRELMERDPHGVLEGMAICAHAIGASRGIVFIRSEYPVASEAMTRAIAAATKAGVLGSDALGIRGGFEVQIVQGMGSYVCGEETALLNAIEGNRGEVRPRPPYPVESGLFGKPTVVVNVETLVNIPWLMRNGVEAYTAMGTAESHGTKAICLNRGFARPGIVEVEFGITLRDVIHKSGGGGADGRELEAVLVGGPMGSLLTPDQWDVPVCFSAMGRRGINLGHAGLVAIPRRADWGAILRHLLMFMRDESCGKCVPCRLGSARAHEMAKHGLTRDSLPRIERIMSLMKDASLCAFGRETPGPVRTILEKFSDRLFEAVHP